MSNGALLLNFGVLQAVYAGPKVVGLIVRGKKRLNTRAREQDYEQV